MGLFDGAADGQGSTADLASLFDLPVMLVVDVRGMGASAAALIEGFTQHRDDVEVAGILFNRVASAEHEALLRRACDDRFAQPVLACLPSDPRLELPARHLGLVPAAELPELESWLDRAAEIVGEAHRSRSAGPPRPAVRARSLRAAAAAAAAARAADRGRGRCRLRLRLPGDARGLAGRGRRDPAVRAARRPAAGPGRRCGLPAGRLSGAARRPARRQSALSRRPARGRGTQRVRLWRVRRLHGARPRRSPTAPASRHAMAGLLPVATSFAEPRRQLGYRRLQAARGDARSARPARPIAATSSTTRA